MVNNNLNQFIVFGMLIILTSCAPGFMSKSKSLVTVKCIGKGVTSVTTLPESSKYAISYCDKEKSFIATGKYSSEPLQIVYQSTHSILLKPIFINDQDEIVFIERKTMDQSILKIVDKDGQVSHLAKPSTSYLNILDMAISPDRKEILFINSRSYTHYSPLAQDDYHDNDFYSISFHDKAINRLSFSNEFRLKGISISLDGETLFSENKLFKKGNRVLKDISYSLRAELPYSKEHFIYPTGFPFSNISSRNQMIISYNINKRGFFRKKIYGFGLFIVQLPNREIVSELVFKDTYMNCPAILEKDNVVLFVAEKPSIHTFIPPERELWSIQLDGTDLNKISLPQ